MLQRAPRMQQLAICRSAFSSRAESVLGACRGHSRPAAVTAATLRQASLEQLTSIIPHALDAGEERWKKKTKKGRLRQDTRTSSADSLLCHHAADRHHTAGSCQQQFTMRYVLLHHCLRVRTHTQSCAGSPILRRHATSSRHATISAALSSHAPPTAARTACRAASLCSHTASGSLSHLPCTPTCTSVSDGYMEGNDGSRTATASQCCHYTLSAR